MEDLKIRNKVNFIFSALFAFFAVQFALNAYAADNLEILLSKYPAQSPRSAAELSTQLLNLGPEAIAKLCERLDPNGESDDHAARYAISGVAKHVSNTNFSKNRGTVERGLLDAFEAELDPEVKRFLFEQLQLCGGNRSVDVLENHLSDPVVCSDAARALAAIGTKKAGKALVRALDGGANECKGAVIQSLEHMQFEPAVSELAKLASANDSLRTQALWALAAFGTKKAGDAIHEITGSIADPRNTGLANLYLAYAESAVREGNTRDAAEFAAEALHHEAQSQVRCAALNILADADPETAHDEAVIGLSDLDPAYRQVARSIFHEFHRPVWQTPEKGSETFDAEPAFRMLFNGEDLTGWRGDTDGYVAENGVLTCRPGGNLYTEEEFSDFVFRFEFKLTPGANNGLGIRTLPTGNAAYTAIELQILDDDDEQYAELQPYQYHGSIYGVVPAKRGYLKPDGEWNRQEVVVRRHHITVILNGTVIVDANTQLASENGTMDGRDHPGLARTKGHIALLGHGTVVQFKNIRILEL